MEEKRVLSSLPHPSSLLSDAAGVLFRSLIRWFKWNSGHLSPLYSDHSFSRIFEWIAHLQILLALSWSRDLHKDQP